MERYLSKREELIAAAVPGIDSARRLARLTDEHLAQLAGSAADALISGKTRWSLIALGGYGSGALLPGSDLDLLVLTDGKAEKLRPFVEAVLYPLWDSGLKVGHQVRSRREQLKAVREDLATMTATLTGRHIAGDAELAEDVLRACAQDASKRLDELLAEMHARPRPSSPYLLEPELKEGAGGRRDFDEMTWTAALRTGVPQADPTALVEAGLLAKAEMSELLEAAESIASARWELHLAGSGDLMDEASAEELTTDPSDVQKGLATTHNALGRVRSRLAGSARRDTGAISSTDVITELARGTASLDELESAAWEGRLEPLVPGFRALMTLRRPGLSHALTVGAHSLRTATLAADIVSGNSNLALDGVAAESARTCENVPALLVAALIHDIGKSEPGLGHEERGAAAAEATAKAFGLAGRSEHIAGLVRHHLLLAKTASSEDLDDEGAILAAAEALGDRSLLAPLHVLTIADSIATGPSAWTDWHAALVGKLVAQLDAALSEAVSGAGIESGAEAVRDRLLEALSAEDPKAHFVRTAPPRYLARCTDEEILRHADHVTRLTSLSMPAASAVDIAPGPVEGSHRVTVIAPDSAGLLSKIAGVLALIGLDILAVEATTTEHRIAVDTFTVRSATLAAVDPTTWAKLERNLALALQDRLAVGVRLAERRKHYGSASTARPARVEIETGDSGTAALRIRIEDRVGLLHDVARAIDESGLEIGSVTALTRSGMADDAFRLTGPGGLPPDQGALGQLKMRLRELR